MTTRPIPKLATPKGLSLARQPQVLRTTNNFPTPIFPGLPPWAEAFRVTDLRLMRNSLLLVVAIASSVAAAEPPRARPPEFTDEDRAAFFPDAFAALVGEKPKPATVGLAAEPRFEAPTDAVLWEKLIAADVLETEIKRQATRLATATRSKPAFKAGGFRDAADSLSLVAAMFAIAADHGGEPRWRDAAASLRDRFGKAGRAADDATDDAHTAAASASADMADLIRGARPDAPVAGAVVDWSAVVTRSTVMRRMGAAEEERLTDWLASERSLRRNAEDARHEAQVLAALAEALVRPGADDADDPDYGAYARRLRDASVQLSAAAEEEDHAAAAAAMIEVSRSCVDCHADYRG